jgi:hypothetical protein
MYKRLIQAVVSCSAFSVHLFCGKFKENLIGKYILSVRFLVWQENVYQFWLNLSVISFIVSSVFVSYVSGRRMQWESL